MRIRWFVMAAAALLIYSTAFAAPKVLSSTQLDNVAAGESTVTDSVGSIAVDGGPNSNHTVVGALADNEAIATHGDDNIVARNVGDIAVGIAAAGHANSVEAIDQSNAGFAVNTGDNLQLTVLINAALFTEADDGSVAIVGSDNHVTLATDITEIDGEIEKGGYGVIAKTADVQNSFLLDACYLEVCAYIKCSFNVETNTMCITGQNDANVITNANALYDQQIGNNLNVTSATASGPGSIPETPGNALNSTADTFAAQAVINHSALIGISYQSVLLGG